MRLQDILFVAALGAITFSVTVSVTLATLALGVDLLDAGAHRIRAMEYLPAIQRVELLLTGIIEGFLEVFDRFLTFFKNGQCAGL